MKQQNLLFILMLTLSCIYISSTQTIPFWLTQVSKEFVNYSTPNVPSETEVTIIGGGISGLSTAFWLRKLNKKTKILLLEERGLCTGASGRNAGFLSPTVSINKPKEIIDLEHETYELIKSISKKYKFDDDMNCFGQGKFSQTKEELLEILRSHNFSAPGIKFWKKEKVHQNTKSKLFNGGRFSKFSCTYSPTKFMKEIFEFIKSSINTQTKTKVLKVENFENHSIIHTTKGKIKTKKVIFATNGYTSKLIPELKDFIYPVRGQIIASKPLKTIWKFVNSANYGSEYYGQRYANDKRIILGGFRWVSNSREIGTFDDSVLNSNISMTARNFLKNFKGLENIEIEYEWTGIMGWSKDGYPLVGNLKPKNNFIISCFNGHGMPVIFTMAKKLANYIQNNINKIPKIFNPKRF
eukprot:gene3297-5738_t